MNKKNLLIYIFYIIASFILGGIFFYKIYSPDGFMMLYCGVDYYNNECSYQNMRPIEFIINKLFLLIFGNNIEYIVLYRIYLVISLLLISTVMYMVYLKIMKILNKKI